MKNLFTSLLPLTTFVLSAQEKAEISKKKFTFGGSLDAYYRTNFTAPNDDNQIAPATSFADTAGFSLGMANIIASYEKGKIGGVADLVFGPRGEAASATVINQLFAYYNISEHTKLTIGIQAYELFVY